MMKTLYYLTVLAASMIFAGCNTTQNGDDHIEYIYEDEIEPEDLQREAEARRADTTPGYYQSPVNEF